MVKSKPAVLPVRFSSSFEHPLTWFSGKTWSHLYPGSWIAPDVSYFSSLLLPDHLKQQGVIGSFRHG
jgi:hypothetical protein